MATKIEKIFTQIGEEIIELTGKDKEAFLTERAETAKMLEEKEKQAAEQKALKIAAYQKLGLTEEEINAIL